MRKNIPGHPQYEIDTEGNVYRTEGGRMDRPLKPSFHKVRGKEYPHGYWYVTLLTEQAVIRSTDEVVGDMPCMKPISIHRLLCLTFKDKPTPEHLWVNHIDGNKLNNRLDNIEWATISQNIQHAFDTGLKSVPSGPDHWMYGKAVSKETKAKMRAAKVGNRHPTFKGYYFASFKRFESASAAGRHAGIAAKTIIQRCKQEKWRLEGYYFIPVS